MSESDNRGNAITTSIVPVSDEERARIEEKARVNALTMMTAEEWEERRAVLGALRADILMAFDPEGEKARLR